MTINDHLKEFGGLPVFHFPDLEPDTAGKGEKKASKRKAKPLPAAESVAWCIATGYDDAEKWVESFTRFLDTVDASKVTAIVVGAWEEAYDQSPDTVIEAVIGAGDRLPALRALFLGDFIVEECEISWITQTQVTPLLAAFPDLEVFGVRGGQNLDFDPVRHESLHTLVVEAGGLPARVVRGIAASDLPALNHLELWLGTSEYGGDVEMADLAPILSGDRLPALTHLALRNSERQDDICTALAAAPVVARLSGLDLSLGVLTDEGATALLSGQPLSHLDSLDLHYNYLSDPMRQRLRETFEPANVSVNVDQDDADGDDEDGWRFVAVGE